MFFKVKFKHTFKMGTREVEYKVYIGQDELEEDVHLSDCLAVEYALSKFFKEYILTEGAKLEVLEVKLI